MFYTWPLSLQAQLSQHGVKEITRREKILLSLLCVLLSQSVKQRKLVLTKDKEVEAMTEAVVDIDDDVSSKDVTLWKSLEYLDLFVADR